MEKHFKFFLPNIFFKQGINVSNGHFIWNSIKYVRIVTKKELWEVYSDLNLVYFVTKNNASISICERLEVATSSYENFPLLKEHPDQQVWLIPGQIVVCHKLTITLPMGLQENESTKKVENTHRMKIDKLTSYSASFVRIFPYV